MTNLTVLLPAWNDAAELGGALGNLADVAAQIGRIDLVVAAGGAEGETERARQIAVGYTAGACTVIPQRPLGKMQALRDAMEVVADRPSRFILLLDADTRLDPSGVARALSFLDERPQLVGAGAVMRDAASGIGAAHDAVNMACNRRDEGLRAVMGCAILARGEAVWPQWERIFAQHDYPLHIDYQVCERIAELSGRSFGICPEFTLQTPRARGLAFLRAERRHHRAMFARRSIGASPRYLAGAAVAAALPIAAPFLLPAALFPPLWPFTLPVALVSARRLRHLKKRYDLARSVDPAVQSVSFGAFVVDEWVFSVSALLGAADYLRRRLDGPSFQGYRAPG